MSKWNQELILDRYLKAANNGKPYTWFNYQPINLPGYEASLGCCGRKCFDRSEALSEHVHSFFGNRRLKIIDWGCNLGFFSFELAKQGHEVIGVDHNRDNIDICRYLARTNEFPVKPLFVHDNLSAETLDNYCDVDLALCFSVLHHLGKQKINILRKMSEVYPFAYLEMDGAGFGYNLLFSFYWNLEEIIETNDRYGSGHRKRKTWFVSNHCNGNEYQNIKQNNLVGSRSVFLVKRDQSLSVVKRELISESTHTWINTNLDHEREMYKKNEGIRFFPKLLNSGLENDFRWIELEYIKADGSFSAEELSLFYDFLSANNLFVLDLTSDSFLFTEGKLKVIDLESLFPLERSLQDLIQVQTKRTSLSLDSYNKQLHYLLKRLNG